LQVSARKSISALVETPTYKNYFDRILQDTEVINNTQSIVSSNINFDFYDTSLRWLYNISEKDQIRINFINISNRLIFNENTLQGDEENSKESSLIQKSTAESVYYKRKWNDSFSSILQVYESDYELEAINSNILQQQRLLQENKVSETAILVNTWLKYNDEITIMNGYQFKETGVTNLTDVDNPIFRQLVREVLRSHAIFSQINFRSYSKKTGIKAGIRYNYIEKFKRHIIEPRLSFNYRLTNHLKIEVLGEFKHQTTSQIINFQNDFLGIEKRRWLLSNNDDIPIIKSKQISIGINYDHKGWLINPEVYIKEVKGITSQSQGFLNQYEFVKSIGRYKVFGIDLLINKRLKKYSTWLSYSFADNNYTFNDFSEIRFPNNLDIVHSISLGTSYSTDHFKISAGINWHSGKPTTRPISGSEIINDQINYQIANSSRLTDYFRIDVSAVYNYNITRKIASQIGVSLWNVSNHKNIINDFYRIRNAVPAEITKNALALTPNINLRILF
jgi:hypothetical protein